MAKVFERFGLSWHDVFIVVALLETSWWIMYAFIDGADIILRMAILSSNVVYHTYLVVQKCVSVVKLGMAFWCIWYGTVCKGRSFPLRVYVMVGLFMDVAMILSWGVIAVDEEWPLSPSNAYGLHYILTFGVIRALVHEGDFVCPFGSSVISTVNGAVVGIPDRSVNSADNLVFFGKGISGVVQYYGFEVQRAAVVSLVWDFLWTLSIIVTQELPEFLFDVIFIGIFGSLPLFIPTENFLMRACRLVVSGLGVVAVLKKTGVRFWVVASSLLVLGNIGFLCYVMSNSVADDSALSLFVICCVFFASNGARVLVLYFVLRVCVEAPVRDQDQGFVNHVYEG
ncbi:hypothetical protein Ocin01_18245, partial [Orchesella cincta]